MQSEKMENGQTVVTLEDGRETLVAAYAVSEARGERRRGYGGVFARKSRLVKKLGQRAGLPTPEATIRLNPDESRVVIESLIAFTNIEAASDLVHPESHRFISMATDMVAGHSTDTSASL